MTLTDERRLVTVLFADLVGFTGRAESSDPEAVRDIQRDYFAAVSREVERYGGAVEKYIGDAVMATFGAPQAHDDDAERALRAALRIRDAVKALDGDLQVRIGVNTGEVVGGLGSGPHAGDYTVSGDAVNVAARLQQTAGPDEIYAGATTRRLSAEAFTFAPLEELALKGRTEGIEAWRLERELPERPRLRGGEARLVGRGRELAALASAIDEAGEGRGLMVALVGEAGIGKSRLALEARATAESNGFATVWTTSRSYATSFPYHLVEQLAGQLMRRSADGTLADALRDIGVEADEPTIDRWATVLDDVLGESEDKPQPANISPAGRQRILVQAITALLRAVSTRQPLLVVLDDLHWADPASLAVVEELLDVVPDLRIAMLALYRSGWSHGWEGKSAYEQLNLRALRPDEARELADQLAPGTHLSAELTDRVLERSAGNPFFLEELLRGEGGAGADPTRRLPETVYEMLLARLDALPAEARQTLQLAAVVGVEFTDAIVAGLAEGGEDRTDAALRTLQRAELVVDRGSSGGPERQLAFRHPLIHEVAYRSLLVSTRRALHGRIARWLEEHGPDELVSALALHYRDSDDAGKARHYLPLAGQRAESLNASREARGWFLDAAEAFRDDPAKRAEMLESAARQAYLIGIPDEAISLQHHAVDLFESAGADVPALAARRWLGRYYWLHGKPDEADRQIQLSIDGLEQLPPSPDLAYAYSFRSQTLMLIPDFVAGDEWARKAIAVAEATGATGALVHAYNNLGTCLQVTGDPAVGLEYLRRSLELALEHNLTDDVGRAYSNMSGQGSAIFPYPYAESEAFLKEALAYASLTIPGGVFDQWIRNGWAEFLVSTARWTEAEQAMDEVDWSRAGAYVQAAIASFRSLLSSYRGRYDEAAAHVAEHTDPAVRIGDLQAVMPVIVANAHAEAGLCNVDAAVDALQRGIEVRGASTESPISTWFLFEAADVLTGALTLDGDVAAGVELVAGLAAAMTSGPLAGGQPTQVAIRDAMLGAAIEQIGVLCRRLGVPSPALNTDLALLGRADAAGRLDAEHRLFDAARLRLWLAEEAGDASLLGDARARFEELGAHPYLARAAELLKG